MLFYLSHSDENAEIGSWRAANEVAYPLLEDSLANDNFRVVIEQYPEYTHRSGFMPSVSSAIQTFIEDVRPMQVLRLSEEQYEVTFTVTVPDEDHDIWIAGNQESLADWAPDVLQMERVSPLERRLTVSVRDWVEVKFYGGEKGAQAWIATGEPQPWGVPRTSWPMIIRPEEGGEYQFEVAGYVN